MVGLIPPDYVLHVIGASGEVPITDNQELVKICKKNNLELILSTDSRDLALIISKYRPEILLIEEEFFKRNLDGEFSYRSSSFQPFKLVYSKANQKDTIFEYLRQGADEVITKDSTPEEFYLKFFSIIRRKEILELNQLTDLPAINRTYKIIEHCLNNLSDWALVHIDIVHFQSYGLMYGVSKGDMVIKETAKFLRDALKRLQLPQAFIGHLGRDNFVIVSDSNSLDAILNTVRVGFKEILNRLYKESDYHNGYIISSAPNMVRRKEGLLDLDIGYCTSIDRNFLSATDVIEQAVKNKKDSESKNKRVLILEEDPDFAQLLEETLEREGSEPKLSEGYETLVAEIAEFKPRTVILEVSRLGLQNFLPLCKKLEKFKKEFGLKILVATNVPGYQNFLSSGADVYIPKPYDLEVLLKEVRRLRYTHV